jgi:hypothetical protein
MASNYRSSTSKPKPKQDQNELDDTATSRLRKFISNSQNEIDSLVASNSILIGEAVVNRADWERLNTRLGNTEAFSKRLIQKFYWSQSS